MDSSGEYDERTEDSSRRMLRDTGKVTQVKPVSTIRRIIRYTIAATATMLLIVLIFEGYKFYDLSSKKLYAENYTPYELTPVYGNGNENSGSKIEKAYRSRKYAEVIKLNAKSVLSVTDVFLTGLSYLETNDMPRAISNFQVVLADVKEDKNPELKSAAEYYLALAYLQNNDYDQAIELMNSINNNTVHLYKDRFSSKYINRVKRLKWR